VFAAIFSAWTVVYGAHQKKKGERMAAASQVPVRGSRRLGRANPR
jgi:hypothetical protein